MLFDLESQGYATMLVPSPLHITQSASACRYVSQGQEKEKKMKDTKKERETETAEGFQGLEQASVMAPGLQL